MSNAVKIRWLLALICFGLFLTAIIARQTYNQGNNLESSAKLVENRLHGKEVKVNDLLAADPHLQKFSTAESDPQYCLSLIDLTRKEHIYIVIYLNSRLAFWSGVRVLPQNADYIKNGSSFLKETNGYYEAIKKTSGHTCVVFFIPVKNNYAYQNRYLQNSFSPDLIHDDNIDIADFTDQPAYDVHTIANQYLFSVKLKPFEVDHLFIYIQLLLWFTASLLLCALVNSFASQLAKNGKVYFGLTLILVFIVALRLANLNFKFGGVYNDIDLFNPAFYASSYFFPSLGDFIINIALLTWFSIFLYSNKHRLIRPIANRRLASFIAIACIVLLIAVSWSMLNLFSGLVLNSKINLDVNNVLNLSGFSMLCILVLCFGFFIFMLFVETCLHICSVVKMLNKQTLVLFMAVIIAKTCADFLNHDFSCFYLLWSFFVILRGFSIAHNRGKYTPLVYFTLIMTCSLISSLKLYFLQSVKEQSVRELLAQKLEKPNDLNAEYLFKQVENEIIHDPLVINYFVSSMPNHEYLKNRLQKLYFEGYLSKYDIVTFEYNKKHRSVASDNSYALNDLKDQVLFSAFKVNGTAYFYRANNAFGFQSYFAILPIVIGADALGTIVIELKSKPLKSAELFPELLVEGDFNQDSEYKDYSYAFYSNGRLVNQSGKYVYSLENNEFKGQLNTFVYNWTPNSGIEENGSSGYSHLIYQPTNSKLIVISKEDNLLYNNIASTTFFFLIFLMFTLTMLGLRWLRHNYATFTWNKLVTMGFAHNFDKVLYKTRIQVSMIFAVVVTLLIVGILTFLSVSNQYNSQQDNIIRDKISRIEVALEKKIANKGAVVSDEDTQISFNSFADAYSADLTLFNTEGEKLITTQPKLFESGLIAPRMNAKAFVYLAKLNKSSFINDEVIGGLNYKAAYTPVRNSKNLVVGFLQLPYFSNETEYRERIGAFLNNMINVYALVLVAIGLFAIGIARQITTPLTLIQQSLSKTIYGRKNEPIKWNHNDEIGSLIKEYNNMIAALENSAQKLAQSERENAWREMAKQVAHEVKNPLTPLKLGLQLLQKAWRDKDPKFDLKFERFSASFLEQIDSLAKIASEFSNFAKMPETHLERFDIFEIVNQAINIFKQTDNFEINYHAPALPFYIVADKDQILRSFNNLLKNAIEAVPIERKGIIDITYSITQYDILLNISDNGSGIPEALRERIFVPNFTTKNSGTGLGLALVKNAIEFSGGNINFETSLNSGTVFHIRFPAAPPKTY